MTLCVVGLGYIGLPTAVLFARAGLRVHGVDVDARAVDRINRGEAHIFEPGLDQEVAEAVATGRLVASIAPVESDAFIIAVPTPFKHQHEPDISYIEAAARAVAPVLRAGNLVVLESTSPVGTTERLAEILSRQRPDLTLAGTGAAAPGVVPVFIAHCPERVLPGQILNELINNDRVIGGIDTESALLAKQLYASVCEGQIHVTSARTAELTKLAENAFRDVNIAFANEMSAICEHLKIDVWEMIGLANLHPRVRILNPGPGVGGHCIAVDPWFIVHSAPDESRLIALARNLNTERPGWVVERIRRAIDGRGSLTISCLGVTYKADTDDIRESPSLEVIELIAAGKLGTVLVTDPYVKTLPKDLDGLAELVDLDSAITKGDVIVLLVDHREYKALPAQTLENKTVVDTRGIWRSAGEGGRATVNPAAVPASSD
jgi:UDP-N-acetyl-D-mannosaminuronic acid dehydrogenase